MRRIISVLLGLYALCACSQEKPLHIVTTGDMHGAWFADSYTSEGEMRPSLMSLKYYVDSLRNAVGRDNVLLLDAGDCLQGDNAAYYYNYVDTLGTHPFVEIAAYLGYDALVVGNHDIETGHRVYDKVCSQLKRSGLSWLGGNAVRCSDGKEYFPSYKILRKAGRKIAVLGFTNAIIETWLSEELYSGMTFEPLLPLVQTKIDEIRIRHKPDIVVVAIHSGTGKGDGRDLENQGLDLLNSLQGADIILCAHDHRAKAVEKDGKWLINSGQRARNAGHAVIGIDGSSTAEVVYLHKEKLDEDMREEFRDEFEAVRDFTLKPFGKLAMDIRSRDAYLGMSDYINLVHTVQLSAEPAQISFAAPLSYNGEVKAGEVNFDDMLTIYPFENQLYILRLQGSEIKSYLEYSYDGWIQSSSKQVLKIKRSNDTRTGAERWSFVGSAFNFDSAAGIVYSVDVSKPYGSRINISSLSDGSPFEEEGWYNVAMTSYRASGGGAIVERGAGLSSEEAQKRIIAKYPAIRDLVCGFFAAKGTVDSQSVGNPSLIGQWNWLPDGTSDRIEADMKLLF